MLRKVVMLAAVSAGLALAGCNTVRGVGDDVKSVANAGDRVI